ncbi:MAG TPA: S49 family peptidase [Rhizomicrobium sp.]|jgi:ClpP class serine protease
MIEDTTEEVAPEADPVETNDAPPPPENSETGASPAPPSVDPPDGNPAQAASARSARVARTDLPHVMGRIFDTPLLIAAPKIDAILTGIGPRLGMLSGVHIGAALSDEEAARLRASPPGNLALLPGADDNDGDDGVPYCVTADGIALIAAEGTLVYKAGWLDAMSGMTAYSDVVAAVQRAAADPAVKATLLMVGSWGGECNGAFDAADAIYAARAAKPIYGVAADNATSAGYALLSAAQRIFVSRTSMTGSVGVVCLHVDQSAADKAEGLRYTYVYSGSNKVDANPHAPLTEDARAWLQADCDRLRGIFAVIVARNRGLSADAVLATQARIMTCDEAIAANFADQMGTPLDALAALRATISPKPVAFATAVPVTAAEAAAAATHAVAAISAGNVIDLESVRALAQGDAVALHVEIVELCRLAEVPDLASDFIRTGASLAHVREALQARRVQASAARPVSGHILPEAGDGTSSQTAQAGWEAAIRAARGGKLKGE